ncbi:radical SAM/SPASM domain-containing protein [Dysgonomonas sp. HDW5A]|uniref:radical SAM/SPASM domain-containing protein n=1 Tax=Dysgonomonas sp. HDW5A TaxID=2714926 RepID=UPI0021037B70|nr:radical SAM protein [Dysgonomonas sp. HDW5A]
MNCNFKCWYCYESHIKSSKINHQTLNKILAYLQHIFEQNQHMKSFSLRFFGGEPLLYFYDSCYPIMKTFQLLCNMHKVKGNIGFTTNGFLINDEMVSKFKEFNDLFFQITLDGYKDEHDSVRYTSRQKGSYDRIVKNITTLVNNNFVVLQRINYTPDKLNNSHKILADLTNIECDKRKNIVTSFHCVWQTSKLAYNTNNYNNLLDQMDLFEANKIPTDSHLRLHKVQEVCYADIQNSAVVNFNGDLFKCTARNFDTVNRVGYLDESGIPVWDSDKIEKRERAKVLNKKCLSCRILPVCKGGCSQHRLEADGGEYCIYNFDDNLIDQTIEMNLNRLVNLKSKRGVL